MSTDSRMLVEALGRWADRMELAAPELNALDGQLGDGDLGATLSKCAANIRKAIAPPPADIPGIFKACAIACTKASGSSLGTLLAVAFMTLTKETAGKNQIGDAEWPGLLAAVRDALSARGGARLGDKTVLDAIEAVRLGLEGTGPEGRLSAAKAALEAAIADFRGRENRIGRARIFAERSRGLDDPGMIAARHMLESIG
ncbi:DAK2 domain-containing protein [Bosea minatitlanensis]|uniref:DAK2 domain-containing protein n=1 Tax=Bosea minatitlanensis TaxID=128782 RepID=A0ABW0F6P4_9HYPH|nr:DAK2 domain-containing protein [Bosea minatitlanensis]MCT4495212.1 dihydroxyacetone kinase subunit L [Bosea minatitlanensis]